VLLTPGPRFVGNDHGSDVLARVDVHRSWPPYVPGRFESKRISSPSRRRFGRLSFDAVFSPGASVGIANESPLKALT